MFDLWYPTNIRCSEKSVNGSTSAWVDRRTADANAGPVTGRHVGKVRPFFYIATSSTSSSSPRTKRGWILWPHLVSCVGLWRFIQVIGLTCPGSPLTPLGYLRGDYPAKRSTGGHPRQEEGTAEATHACACAVILIAKSPSIARNSGGLVL